MPEAYFIRQALLAAALHTPLSKNKKPPSVRAAQLADKVFVYKLAEVEKVS